MTVTKENIELVHSIIRKMNNDQLDDIWQTYSSRKDRLQSLAFKNFMIGDQVWIKHKRFNKTEVFIVEKINKKTISVFKKSDQYQKYNVSPELLKNI
jgi:hypothetical protein